jgi:hypothetical protein
VLESGAGLSYKTSGGVSSNNLSTNGSQKGKTSWWQEDIVL